MRILEVVRRIVFLGFFGLANQGVATLAVEFDCQLTRAEDDPGTSCDGDAIVVVWNTSPLEGDQESLNATSPTVTFIEPSASYSYFDSSGFAVVKMTAINLTSPGATTRLPTVDFSLSPTLNVTYDSDTVYSFVGSDASSKAEFDLDDDNEEVDIHYTLKIVAIGSHTAGKDLNYNFDEYDDVVVRIDGLGSSVISLRAERTTNNLWKVTKSDASGTTVLKENVATFDETITGTVAVTCDGSSIEFDAIATINPAYYATDTAVGLSQYHFSGSAWAVVTPRGKTPLDGDFDADGDVDGDDFLILQSNSSLDFGATLGQGDADGDGDVDGDDILIWQANFGASYDD